MWDALTTEMIVKLRLLLRKELSGEYNDRKGDTDPAEKTYKPLTLVSKHDGSRR